MGSLTLYIGPATSFYYFSNEIHQDISTNGENSIIYLLPVNRAVRYFKKRLISSANSRAVFDPQIFTFSSLLRHISDQCGSGKKIIGDEIKLILIDHLLTENKDEFAYFSGGIGVTARVSRMFNEFLQFGYGPGSFTRPPLSAQDKYNDFAALAEKMHAVYQENLADEQSLLNETIENLGEDDFRRIFPETGKIYINGYGMFTPPMLRFINRVKQWCDVQIKLEYVSDNPELFTHTNAAFESLSKMADHVKETSTPKPPIHNILFHSLRPLETKLKTGTDLFISKALDRNAEVAEIAAEIRRLHHEDGIALERIGVTFPAMDLYVSIVRRVFEQYKLPFNISTGFALAQSPLIQNFLKPLQVVISGYAVTEIIRLLQISVVDPGFRPALLRQTAARLRLQRLSGNWHQKFISLEAHAGKKGAGRISHMAAKLNNILDILGSLERPGDVNTLHKTYINVLEKLNLINWYENTADNLTRFEQEKEFRAFNRFIKQLDRLNWALNFLHKDRKINVSEYFRFLRLLIRDDVYNLREWSSYGIQVMPRLEIQSLDTEVLFIGGLVEGEFPRRFSRDIFFNDDERQQMGLNATEDLLYQDRIMFYQLLFSGPQRVCLSHPRFANESAMVPSTFLNSLRDICEIRSLQEKTAPEYVLNRDNFIENLATGFPAETEKNISRWLPVLEQSKTEYWFDAVAAVFQKMRRGSISNFEGNLSNNSSIISYLNSYVNKHQFSITALESYAFCPMQFFLQRIVKIEDEDEGEETITALEKGALIHRILFRFFNRLKQNGLEKAPWKNFQILNAIAQEEFNSMPFDGALWTLEKENIFGTAGKPGLWQKFIDTEEEGISNTGFYPAFFEVAFGGAESREERDPASVDAPLVLNKGSESIKLTGKIDRIDVDDNGNLLVIDYKISRDSGYLGAARIQRGESLQLPVYLEALHYIFKAAQQKYTPAAAAYYQVRDAENCKRKIVITAGNVAAAKAVAFHQIKEQTRQIVFDHVKRMRTGNFEHTSRPSDTRCAGYCPYATICRKDIAKLNARAAEE